MGRMILHAATAEGYDAKLFSYELETHVPIAAIATVIVGKRWNSPDLYAHLIEVIERCHIDIVIPFVDGAIEVAARLETMAQQVWAPVSNIEIVKKMYDKVASDELFRKLNLPLPALFNPLAPSFPAIAKPRFGSASKGIRVLTSIRDYNAIDNAADFLIQQYIPDAVEYSVDCYVSREGRVAVAVPRLRLDVVGGEVVRTVTVNAPDVSMLAHRVIRETKLTGAVTIQFLRDPATNELYLMEINPRLGGGAVCSVHAGADIPRAMIREWGGMPSSPVEWSFGVEIVRYLQEIVYKNNF